MKRGSRFNISPQMGLKACTLGILCMLCSVFVLNCVCLSNEACQEDNVVAVDSCASSCQAKTGTPCNSGDAITAPQINGSLVIFNKSTNSCDNDCACDSEHSHSPMDLVSTTNGDTVKIKDSVGTGLCSFQQVSQVLTLRTPRHIDRALGDTTPTLNRIKTIVLRV